MTIVTTLKRWRILRWTLLLLVVVVAGPYLFSRAASPWSVVRLRTADNGDAESAAAKIAEIQIGTYNIAHGRGTAQSNWKGGDVQERIERLSRIARLLADAKLDVVVLNEVDFKSSWSNGQNQAEAIARRAGFDYWVEQRNCDFAVGHYTWRFGNAVLSKYPITDARAVDFPGYSAWETVAGGKKRGVLCTIRLAEGRSIRVLGVHLSHRSEAIRVESAKMIDRLRSESDAPLVCAGDFNSTPLGFPHADSTADGENAMTLLHKTEAFEASPVQESAPADLTFSSTDPKSVIDWILVAKPLKLARYRVVESTLSDHFPVFTTVVFGGSNREDVK